MRPVSIHQADVWAFQVFSEAENKIKEKGDNFDAMLFVESKEVRDVLRKIIESLNQKHELGLDDKHNRDHYSNAIQSLTKVSIKVYGIAENLISATINEIAHSELKSDYARNYKVTEGFILNKKKDPYINQPTMAIS